MLLLDDLMEFSAVYSVEVLPLPVGPVTRIMPCGRARNDFIIFSGCGSKLI